MGMATTASVLVHGAALGVEPEVPARLQVSLLDRVIPFDRNFAVRVHGRLSAVVVVEAADPDSTRAAAQVLNELNGLSTLGTYPLAVARLGFTGVQPLVEECKRLQAGIVYFAPGLSTAMERLAAALQGARVLTVGALPEHAKNGTVLSFGVRSGKPRVIVNLLQARQQEVDFRADFLRMAEVVA
jgi:YfiR/HmsC-like